MKIVLTMELDEIETTSTKQYVDQDITDMLKESTVNYKNIELRIDEELVYKAVNNS